MMKRVLKIYLQLWSFTFWACPQNTGSAPPSTDTNNGGNTSPDPSNQDGAVKIEAPSTDYDAWMADHPSALGEFEWMMDIAKGRRIVVFLDYDGTLSPIVDDPLLAFMSDSMRSAVREVARHYPTAIISGRSRDKVYEFVQLDDVYYAGSHGMDIMAPPRQQEAPLDDYQRTTVDSKGNEVTIFQPARDFLPEILQILKELEEVTKSFEGVSIEDNRFCLSVHFRRAREQDYQMIEESVNVVVAKHLQFHLTRGRKVMEIRPTIKWNKGNALEYLLETLGLSKSSDVHPIYIGDDRTDEDAFKVIQNRGQGFSIIVSSKVKDTGASYSLREPSEVLLFLVRLASQRHRT